MNARSRENVLGFLLSLPLVRYWSLHGAIFVYSFQNTVRVLPG